MSVRDREYFLLRAEQEVEAAQRSDKREAVAIHYQLAEHYFERLDSLSEDETAEPA